MGQTPTTENKIIEVVDGLVKAGITGGEKAMKAYLMTSPAAFLEGPVLSLFTNQVLEIFGDALYQNVHDLASKIVINVQTGIEKSAVSRALVDFNAALKSGNAQTIAQAKVEYETAIAALVHSDGSALPK